MAACIGATSVGGRVAGTIELLARSLRTGGIILIGEPYWRQLPPTEDVAKECLANAISDFLMLPELLASFGRLGFGSTMRVRCVFGDYKKLQGGLINAKKHYIGRPKTSNHLLGGFLILSFICLVKKNLTDRALLR
ncbi:MAG: hypothetical protein WBJ42_07340 [Thermovirgaceae bacterium]